MGFFLELLVNGLSLGFLYGIAAMGFVMIYKSSSVLNFAHGELLALGAYVFLALTLWLHLPVILSFVLTLALCFSFGILIERVFLRPLVGEPLIFVIMFTIGLASMLRGALLLLGVAISIPIPTFYLPLLRSIWDKSSFSRHIASRSCSASGFSSFGLFSNIPRRESLCGR